MVRREKEEKKIDRSKIVVKDMIAALLVLLVGTGSVYAQTPTPISSLSSIGASGDYIITADIDASGFETSIASFSGTLEAAINPTTHMPYRIQNLSVPLFTTLTGTVKNLVLENVSISGGTDVGAIACNMTGTSTKKAVIYNCGILSGSVGGSGNVGGLVGVLGQAGNTTATNDNCYARVINCYSFANITGGSEKGGIVGYNNYASKYNDQRTMVMNCMFYGEIDYSSGTLSPIYGGLEINNYTTGHLNNYNYYRYEALYSINNTKTTTLINKYNCALPAEERFLNRFEFFRNIVNSTRELAAWYATGSVADAHTKMLKWVLDKSIAPYPIQKEQGTYPSVVNYDPVYTNDETGEKVLRNTVTERNKGKVIGSSFTVTISGVGSNAPTGATLIDENGNAISTSRNLSLVRTDKDYNNFNFNYDKVQLPYYNEVGTKNCTGNRVVTGWKITGMSKSAGSFTTGDEAATNANGEITSDPYNFADRDCTEKDIYSVSGRVFSQGAYFDVPTGVTSIIIEPYWANCVYLSDLYYDKYISATNGPTIADVDVTGSARYTNGSSYPINEDNQIVYTTIGNAMTALSPAGEASSTVYDYAVVLVGNYHCNGTPYQNRNPFTIMSADLNNDNEPDYSFIFRSGKQEKIAPIRFDFVNVPALSMTHKVGTAENVANNMSIPGNFKNLGWFELTNTCNIVFSQFEMDYWQSTTDLKTLSPCILLGGVIEQFVSAAYVNAGTGTTGEGTKGTDKTLYIHLGGNVCFPNVFSHGAHMNKKNSQTHHCPISVTGGDYNLFYLTGYMQPDCPNYDDNAECYISGGRFAEVGGAGYEGIGAANSANGNIVWQISYADIDRFFGGGINDKKPVLGNITTVISDSHVGMFCGGPKFGNMASDKTVKTTATDCTFDNFFGAGYGGTAFVRKNTYDQFGSVNYTWSNIVKTYTTGSNDKDNINNKRGMFYSNRGISVSYDYRNFAGSTTNTTGQFFVNYASLSLAQCNDVTSKLKGCTINENYFGGGSLGKVAGDVNSTLTDCTVSGNVFGAGKSATPPPVEVYPASGFTVEPYYNPYTGMFQKGTFPASVEYIWSDTKGSQTNNSTSGTLVDEGDDHWIHTNVPLGDLGTVEGNATLTLAGGTTVSGNVYGGGDASAVKGASHAVTVTLQGDTQVNGNVFGGGNQGPVEGSTEVKIEQ